MTVDLDSWNITTEPRYFDQYLAPLTSINLAHHTPEIQDNEIFKEWVMISQGGCLVRMPNQPDFKAPLLDYLRTELKVIAHLSTYPTHLVMGSPVIAARMLQEALLALQVPRIRLNSYGMKCPARWVNPNFGGVGDPSLGELNSFDIGFTYKCDQIILAHISRRTFGLDGYPMLLALGRGFGSVLLNPHLPHIARVKGYPALVHALKATSSKTMKDTPRNTNAWRARLRMIRNKMETLRKNDERDLCGFRFEATVRARTFGEAKDIVMWSGLLEFQYYLPQDLVQFLPIKVPDYFQQLESLLVRLEQMPISQRNITTIPITSVQRQRIIDLQNALGWNVGRYCRPTRWDHPNPWWATSKFYVS